VLPPRFIYGLGLRTNVAFAALQALPIAEQVDVSLSMGTMPPGLEDASGEPATDFYVSDECDAAGVPAVRASTLRNGAYYRLAYADGTRVVLDTGANGIWVTAPDGATVEDTATYLLGPAMGFALRLRGVTSLHASSIAFGDRAVAFVGPAGAGKSTLAAAFARRGNAILTDDVAPLVDDGDRFQVQPAYRRVRLWPDSVEFLFGTSDALPRITPNWEKRFLNLDGDRFRFAPGPLPLAAIYVLAPREERGEPLIEDLPERSALMKLVSHTYTARLLDRALRAREFELLGRLVQNVTVRALTPCTDPATIDDLCDRVQRDVERLHPTPH
jgi:hypothetical protein